ncbi:hypothetical protein P280DRAFT_247806 [Massarina eburnea CBS 473.64]|uniref:Uncharacterized protein n=1 Tax=Massarina eburnea CBS 473.64 TaxID=1395130 RepID=A0A6A6S6Q5_9PLEO|nr:hypothetical protein P280DRAFT_247806 [Massarina eburnea CBS 473.64]
MAFSATSGIAGHGNNQICVSPKLWDKEQRRLCNGAQAIRRKIPQRYVSRASKQSAACSSPTEERQHVSSSRDSQCGDGTSTLLVVSHERFIQFSMRSPPHNNKKSYFESQILPVSPMCRLSSVCYATYCLFKQPEADLLHKGPVGSVLRSSRVCSVCLRGRIDSYTDVALDRLCFDTV